MTENVAGNSAMAGPSRTLALLALANFAIGMGAFVVIGVLTPIGEAFAITPAAAGWVMTVYALTYAVASPLLVALTGAADRRIVLITGLALFAAGAIASAAAPGFTALLGGRALMAVGGGLVTPVTAAIAAALVEPAGRGRALATVFGGLTFAQVLGVPAGAWLGFALGWQAAFIVVTVLTLAALAATLRGIPAGIRVPVASLAVLAEVLSTRRLMLAISFTALFIGGIYCVYTYLSPLLVERFGMGRNGVTAMLVVFGLGAVLGNRLGGFSADKLGPVPTLVILAIVQMLIMPVITVLPVGILITGVLLLVWSIFGWSFMAAQQARLAALDPARLSVLFALNAAALYVGGSIGSLIGGGLIAIGGTWLTGIGGAAVVILALWSLRLTAKAG